MDDVFLRPRTLTAEQASGLLLTGVTAAHLLHATTVAAGETVLVHGASGGVGSAAVQLLVDRGARVIGTAGPGRQDDVRALGAEPVPYGDGLLERVRDLAPDGVHVALDAVGTDEAVDVSLALVADRDRIATVAAFARAPGLGIRLLGGGPGADPGTQVRSAAREALVALAGEGRLTVPGRSDVRPRGRARRARAPRVGHRPGQGRPGALTPGNRGRSRDQPAASAASTCSRRMSA